jgi:trimethylamine-N-oxide reductase (cytochrome c)
MYDGKETWVDEIPEHRLKKQDGRRYWIIHINPSDATERRINDGDLVRVWNNRGSVVCAARVSERTRQGTVHSPESSSVYEPKGEPGSAESVDLGGCVNILTPSKFMSKNACGMAPNSCLVEVEKWMMLG